jgi:hypothetical protein
MGRVDSTPPPYLMSESKRSPRTSGTRSGFGQSDFGHSSFSNSRYVAAEELFDIQEQADFFMSLDQPEQAIEVLKNHITDSVETSALAYMDLFDIYHQLERTQEYSELREEFNQVFNAQVPNFQDYGQKTDGLEAYPVALQNIQRYWPGLQTLDVIEESIFRQPDAQIPPFDMLAYRELMMLYALAKELNKPGNAYKPMRSTSHINELTQTGLSQLDELPDLGLVGLAQGNRTSDVGLGLDLNDSNASDLQMLDFDLNDVGELPEPKGAPSV